MSQGNGLKAEMQIVNLAMNSFRFEAHGQDVGSQMKYEKNIISSIILWLYGAIRLFQFKKVINI